MFTPTKKKLGNKEFCKPKFEFFFFNMATFNVSRHVNWQNFRICGATIHIQLLKVHVTDPRSVPFVVYTTKMFWGLFFCAKTTGLGSVCKTCWRKPSCWFLMMMFMRTCHFSGAGVSPYSHIAVCLCRYACAHKEMLYNPANSDFYTHTTQNVRLGSKAFSFCTNHTPTVWMCVCIHTTIPSLSFGLFIDHTSQ
jgi:hypothetical protein